MEVAGPTETPELRHAACCQSEPPCRLCPLEPANATTPLLELWRRGLYANLPELGFTKR